MFVSSGQHPRTHKTVGIDADLVVVGGGLSGVCCALTAARAGSRVVLVQDRPVLGGNASSEVRLWVLGATSHMGNNNRWSREGGVVDELLVENLYRNPEGNPVIFDTVLLEKVVEEPNLTLLLNTSAHDVSVGAEGKITGVTAFCSQNSTRYELAAPLFCDASGDGVLGFLSGAAFRMGAESRVEFGERLAPSEPTSDLLGHSIYFYTRDTGKPVRFVPPSYALKDISQLPRYKKFNAKSQGCQLWWIEYGGKRDTIHEAEEIKWELWKVVYGVWDYIKNSGGFPEAETMTLEWVGTIPGKRESRRFEGDHILIQQDIIEQREHYDAVSYGGWAVDLHPPDGVYSKDDPCTQWHPKGVYQIPYRTMYSRNVPNLFLAGRILSASHIAFGSTRVMATCGHNAQAVGMAAALCKKEGLLPRDLAHPSRIADLQRALQRAGQYIPGVVVKDENDKAPQAKISASSQLKVGSLKRSGQVTPLTASRAILLPVGKGRMPSVTLFVEPHDETDLVIELRGSSRKGNFTPDVVRERHTIEFRPSHSAPSGNGSRYASMRSSAKSSQGVALAEKAYVRHEIAADGGARPVTIEFRSQISEVGYAMVCLLENPLVSVETSDQFVAGITSLVHRENGRVAKSSSQCPPEGIGVDAFEFWTPERRPAFQNLAVEVSPVIELFGPENVTNGVARPTNSPNAWVAGPDDTTSSLTLRWPRPMPIEQVELSFDTDADHALESVLMGHPENVMPQCVRSYRIYDSGRRLLADVQDNHQTRNIVRLPQPIETDALTIELDAPSEETPASLFEVRCY